MAKYRKKPVVIEAMQWTGDNTEQCLNFMGSNGRFDTIELCIKIDTLEGTMAASLNDYIIKGVDGEFYPCKQDIFEKTYELVEEE